MKKNVSRRRREKKPISVNAVKRNPISVNAVKKTHFSKRRENNSFIRTLWKSHTLNIFSLQKVQNELVIWLDLEVMPIGITPVAWRLSTYLSGRRDADTQETISSQIIACSAVLTVTGGFPTRWARSWRIFRCTASWWCPGDNFLANLRVPGVFWTRWVRFWGLFRCTVIPWCPGDNFLANLSVSGGFFIRWARFRELFRCTSTQWNPGHDFDANRSFSHEFKLGGFLDTLRTF